MGGWLSSARFEPDSRMQERNKKGKAAQLSPRDNNSLITSRICRALLSRLLCIESPATRKTTSVGERKFALNQAAATSSSTATDEATTASGKTMTTDSLSLTPISRSPLSSLGGSMHQPIESVITDDAPFVDHYVDLDEDIIRSFSPTNNQESSAVAFPCLDHRSFSLRPRNEHGMRRTGTQRNLQSATTDGWSIHRRQRYNDEVQRSRSLQIPQSSKESSCHTAEHDEVFRKEMYNRATWRMYDRILKARSSSFASVHPDTSFTAPLQHPFDSQTTNHEPQTPFERNVSSSVEIFDLDLDQ